MNGQGYTDHRGPSLERAGVSFEQRGDTPTWIVAARNGAALVQVVDHQVVVNAERLSLNGPDCRGLMIALAAAWAHSDAEAA